MPSQKKDDFQRRALGQCWRASVACPSNQIYYDFYPAAFAHVSLGKLCRVGCKGHTMESQFVPRLLTPMRKEISIDPRSRNFVWPDKCYCTGVNVARIIEVFNVSPDVTGPASLVQASDLSPQTFKASLLALSRASSEMGAAYEPHAGIRLREKGISEGEKQPPIMPHTRAVVSPALTKQVVQQQALATQQPSLINATLSAVQLPAEEPYVSQRASAFGGGQANPDVTAVGFPPIEWNISQPRAAKPDSVPSNHAQKESDISRVAPALPLAIKTPQIATRLSNAVANVIPGSLFTEVKNQPVDAVARVAANLVAYAVPGVVPDLPSAVLGLISSTLARSVAVAVPKAVPSAFPDALQNSASAQVPNAIPNPSPRATPTPALPGAVNASGIGLIASRPSPAFTGQAIPPVAESDPSTSATALIAPKSSPASTGRAIPPVAESDPNASATALIAPKSSPASTGRAISPVAASDPNASATSLIAPKLSPDSSGHANPPAAASDPSAFGTSLIASKLSPDSTGRANPPVEASAPSTPAQSLIASKSAPASTGQANPPVVASNLSGFTTSLIAAKVSPASTGQADLPVAASDPNRLATGLIAPNSTSASTGESNPATLAPDPSGLAAGLIAPGATSDQLGALIQLGGEFPVAAEAAASSVAPAAVANSSDMAVTNQKDGANAINDAAGLKQHSPSASDQTGSSTGSRETALSRDPSQGGSSQQGQSTAAPVQMSSVSHATVVVDHAQNGGVTAPLQTAPMLTGASGHAPKTTDTSSPAAIPLPQAVSVINTAKLIQSTGQSEMRVDMRSNDFGNISISTSANRDLISAQISLDHGELARTLAAHLPEMQARLGSQAMDVRIDMNGQAAGQRMGTSAGTSNGSEDGSRGDRQQEGSASRQSANGSTGYGNSIAAAVLTPGEGRHGDRLDIRA
jgi:hypothetical protein